jgi:hypothetical protein
MQSANHIADSVIKITDGHPIGMSLTEQAFCYYSEHITSWTIEEKQLDCQQIDFCCDKTN